VILKKISSIVVLLFLVGCASATFHTDDEGRITKVTTWGNIEAEYKTEHDSAKVNTKTDIFKGLVSMNKLSAT